MIAQGGQRRSARLLALEQQNNLKGKKVALPMNVGQTLVTRKRITRRRGRKKKGQDVYEEGCSLEGTSNVDSSFIVPSASESTTERTIGYILDMLEVKDEHELFSMPDNIEAYNYAESLSKPGDFATLRQKHKDGMYESLEQFENDVYMVFCKAINCNSPHSVLYREGRSLQEQAMQVFKSLRNNAAYAEFELSMWHQGYFNYRKSTTRQRMVGSLNNVARSVSQQVIPKNTTHGDSVFKSETSGRAGLRRNPQSRSSLRLRGRRVASQDFNQSNLCTKKQRHTYRHEGDSEEQIITMVSNKPVNLVYNYSAPSYKDSLTHFVKNSGPVAKMVAEMKCKELDLRVLQAQSVYALWRPLTSTSTAQFMSPSSNWSIHANLGANLSHTTASRPQWPPYSQTATSPVPTSYTFLEGLCSPCSSNLDTPNAGGSSKVDSEPISDSDRQLHTDELLALFSQTGTHESLQRSISNNASSPTQVVESHLEFDSLLSGGGDQAVAAVGARSGGRSLAAETGRRSNRKLPGSQPANDLSYEQSWLSSQKVLAAPEIEQELATRTKHSSMANFQATTTTDQSQEANIWDFWSPTQARVASKVQAS